MQCFDFLKIDPMHLGVNSIFLHTKFSLWSYLLNGIHAKLLKWSKVGWLSHIYQIPSELEELRRDYLSSHDWLKMFIGPAYFYIVHLWCGKPDGPTMWDTKYLGPPLYIFSRRVPTSITLSSNVHWFMWVTGILTVWDVTTSAIHWMNAHCLKMLCMASY